MDLPHLAAIQWKLTPENWYGEITIHSALNGDVSNCGVKRYCDLNGNHLKIIGYGLHSNDGLYLEVSTTQSEIRMSQAMRTRIYKNDILLQVERKYVEQKNYCAQEMTFECVPDETILVEKIASIYTSRDFAISEPVSASCQAVEHAGTFADLRTSQVNSWKKLWDRFDVQVSGNDQSQKLIRLHIFHVLQTASHNTYDLDVGVPSRGLHGEAYRGHIMWDELFVFPLLNFRNPLLTREFLLYRYRRLPQARLAAKNSGYKGAMFPWQSGSDGREESQRIHLNPFSGHWIPDETYLQRHINAGIVYSISLLRCKFISTLTKHFSSLR
jgi:trehalose/maltose hydrolase-like predicted phosphorylase